LAEDFVFKQVGVRIAKLYDSSFIVPQPADKRVGARLRPVFLYGENLGGKTDR
jgi:hypothetical protein